MRIQVPTQLHGAAGLAPLNDAVALVEVKLPGYHLLELLLGGLSHISAGHQADLAGPV